MKAARQRDTAPEVKLRSELHRLGLRYRIDACPISGWRRRADIVFPRAQVAVFVDGCFWHVCPIHGREPTRNEWYWTPKLRRNVERDRLADTALTAAGWTVVRVWEHGTAEEALAAVLRAVGHEEKVWGATDTSA